MSEKPLEIVTSMGALVRDERHRREVRIPKKEDLPPNIAWIRDERLGDVPAVIGLTGRLAAIREFPSRTVAQWQVYCTPPHPHVRDRLSRQDSIDILNDLHAVLTRLDPPRGATYTVYFAVPHARNGPVDPENFFDSTHSSIVGLLRDRELELRASRNFFRHLHHLVFGFPQISDPWNDNRAMKEKIDRMLRLRLKQLLMLAWTSWSKEPDVRPLLKMQHVPVEDDTRTVYRADNVDRRILERLPLAMHRTLFAGAIPDLEDDENPYIASLQRR